MDENKETLEVSTEEQNAEAEMTTEVNDDELREKLAEEIGVDPDADSELLDKLVEKEKGNRKKLSDAIKQKINWRAKAQASQKPQEKPGESKTQTKEEPNLDELVERKIAEREEKRDLETLNLPDDLKTEVRELAKLKGISVREAAQQPYIKFRIEEAEREQRIEAATPKRSKKGSYIPSGDPSKPLNPADFDLNSEEGRKAWADAKGARRQYMEKNG